MVAAMISSLIARYYLMYDCLIKQWKRYFIVSKYNYDVGTTYQRCT